ncbi:amino acid permease-associated region [Ancylobacter novellus DSM 506]|uniref:Amino acid permease-associated region n=1 Tax=Ancylobacter novellus (strain ATCC 8093 / DSM 506 / JCM 20403 / CCM 1077 / IAM 12100 / NBRC 12443 / NCIMB 10456) TaxID=639283 RepID=D7A7W2_ANCN5|nr:amino acid permease [Ancylobacter novellus]ADH90420.1 amino acid permease-associated region [Ancylobacter novellus DSM 506]
MSIQSTEGSLPASGSGGVTYTTVDVTYFEARGLKRYAGVASLWALGVGAVISGHFSGWNLGLSTGGWGGLFVASVIIAIMYLGLTLSIAEMSAALPHTGAAYSFARTAMGPWGGFITGLCENVEYVVTPAVVVFFIGSYLGSIFGTPPEFQPVYWVFGYIVFVGLNVVGVELSFKVTLVVTLLALACLVAFWVSAIPNVDFTRWALNIGADGTELPEGGGPFLPFGVYGILASLPFAVWLFLAIEQLPLAAEESIDPKRDLPRGIILGIGTLIVSAFMILWLNSSVANGAFALGKSGEPLLDGFRAIYGDGLAKVLALVAVIGLIASFHTIIYAQGRQIYSLSRAGYFPRWMSITHGTRKTPHLAMLVGAVVALVLMLAIWFSVGAEQGALVIGGTLLNMAVFGAMLSYVMQALSFILLRKNAPHIERPYKSPFGVLGAALTVIIAVVTLFFQLSDPVYRAGVIGVAIWFALGIVYFALKGRHKLVLSPEEEFALSKGTSEYKSH